MLYSACKQYLLAKLKGTGLKSNPYTTQKALTKSLESHVGAVLFYSETYSRNGSKKRFIGQEGAKHKRRKVFDRTLSFTVTIGDYTDEAVEVLFETFIASLDAGIFVPIEVEEADWVDSDDSLLKAKVAVQVKINFQGGVYRDTGFAPVSEVDISSVERQ